MTYTVNNSAISLVADSGVIVTQDAPYSGDSTTPVIKTGAGEFVLNQSNDIQGGVTIASGTSRWPLQEPLEPRPVCSLGLLRMTEAMPFSISRLAE
jgi:autotransporter-associated beta strand protein